MTYLAFLRKFRKDYTAATKGEFRTHSLLCPILGKLRDTPDYADCQKHIARLKAQIKTDLDGHHSLYALVTRQYPIFDKFEAWAESTRHSYDDYIRQIRLYYLDRLIAGER